MLIEPIVFQDKDPQIVKDKDGKLYIEGIWVWKEQLTKEELRKYYPEDFKIITCPLCDKEFDISEGRQPLNHFRLGHPDWWEQHKELLQIQDVKELQDSLNETMESHVVAEEKT